MCKDTGMILMTFSSYIYTYISMTFSSYSYTCMHFMLKFVLDHVLLICCPSLSS